MHDNETAELVYRLDGGVASLFGYTGCCKPHPDKGMPRPLRAGQSDKRFSSERTQDIASEF